MVTQIKSFSKNPVNLSLQALKPWVVYQDPPSTLKEGSMVPNQGVFRVQQRVDGGSRYGSE